MDRRIILTKDGSHTIGTPEGLTYHSTFGSIQESGHIFIQAGLIPALAASRPDQRGDKDASDRPSNHAEPIHPHQPLYIFEMGFGTGLNALLTFAEAITQKRKILYSAIELFPLSPDLTSQLNYCRLLNRPDLEPLFQKMHTSPWNETTTIHPECAIHKIQGQGQTYIPTRADLVYFDAFDPEAQPDLWTEDVFGNLFSGMNPGGILVTYSSKGAVRRALQAVGFTTEKLSGPPGKREFLRAKKPTE